MPDVAVKKGSIDPIEYGLPLPEDAESILQLRAANWSDYAEHLGPATASFFEQEGREIVRPTRVAEEGKRIKDFLTRGREADYWFKVARSGDHIAGYISVLRERAGHPREVTALHVRREHIGRGIGSALLAGMFDELGSGPTALDVVEGVPAVGFYRKLDFVSSPGESWGEIGVLRMIWNEPELKKSVKIIT
jgi:ribosomal protein S18 acetylase RimI-like enzyme